MKKQYIIIFIFLFIFTLYGKTFAQSPEERGFDIDVDPIAFGLNGFSFHGGYITGAYRFDLGVFGIDIPEWMHGNEDFSSSFAGGGLKIDRFFKGHADGFFAGIDGGIQRLNITHTATDADKDRIQYTVGMRGGYRWNTGLGNLFITPWIGLGYVLNAEDIEIDGDVFESSPFVPFPTIHIGWKL